MALKNDYYKVGLLLLGANGLGKSCLAGKICERFDEHTLIIVRGKLTGFALQEALTDAFFNSQDEKGQQILSQKKEMTQKLANLCATSFKEKNYLLLLDGFEQNLEYPAHGKPLLLPEAVDLSGTLLYYLQFSGKMTQLIITSRYEFPLTRHGQNLVEERLEKIWLTSFQDTEQRKKARGLKNIFNYENPDMISYLVSAGQGNPLLMEWLDLLASQMKKVEQRELIRAVKDKKGDFISQYKLREPLQRSSKELVSFLRWTGIYRRPVKKEGIQRMAEKTNLADWQTLLSEALSLSLVEYDRAHQGYQVTPLLRKELSAALENPEVAHEVAGEYYRNLCEEHKSINPLLTEEWIFHAIGCGQEEVASQQGAILVNYYREHQALHKSRQVGEWILSKKKSDSYSEHDTLLKHSLEATLHLLKDHPQPEKHLQQVLQIHRLAYGTKDPQVAVDLKNLGLVYLKTGQKDKARNYLEKAYNLLLQDPGPEHPETRKVKEALDRLF
jgi:tetratricopeptide (TPR) repeat protein